MEGRGSEIDDDDCFKYMIKRFQINTKNMLSLKIFFEPREKSSGLTGATHSSVDVACLNFHSGFVVQKIV